MIDKRFIPILLLTGILAIVAVAGYLLPERSGAVPKRVAMVNTGGPVVFEHSKHEKWGKSCEACHHDLASGAKQPLSCRQCHGVSLDKDFVATHEKKFSSESCLVCHHYTPGTQDWGHKTHQETFGVECTSCHHADTSIEPEPTNCSNCHEAGNAPSKAGFKADFKAGDMPNLADAVHAKCAGCHAEWFDDKARSCLRCHFDKAPESIEPGKRLHANMDTKTCSKCHEREPGKLIPGRMQAQHATCMGCHKKVDKGPRTQQDCGQCHMK